MPCSTPNITSDRELQRDYKVFAFRLGEKRRGREFRSSCTGNLTFHSSLSTSVRATYCVLGAFDSRHSRRTLASPLLPPPLCFPITLSTFLLQLCSPHTLVQLRHSFNFPDPSLRVGPSQFSPLTVISSRPRIAERRVDDGLLRLLTSCAASPYARISRHLRTLDGFIARAKRDHGDTLPRQLPHSTLSRQSSFHELELQQRRSERRRRRRSADSRRSRQLSIYRPCTVHGWRTRQRWRRIEKAFRARRRRKFGYDPSRRFSHALARRQRILPFLRGLPTRCQEAGGGLQDERTRTVRLGRAVRSADHLRQDRLAVSVSRWTTRHRERMLFHHDDRFRSSSIAPHRYRR